MARKVISNGVIYFKRFTRSQVSIIIETVIEKDKCLIYN